MFHGRNSLTYSLIDKRKQRVKQKSKTDDNDELIINWKNVSSLNKKKPNLN